MLMPTYIQTNIQQESKEQKGVYIKQFILGLYWVDIELILSEVLYGKYKTWLCDLVEWRFVLRWV